MKNYKKILLVSAAVFLLAAGCNRGAGIKNQESGIKGNQQPQTQTQPPAQNQAADVRPWFTQTVEGSNFNQSKTEFTQGQSAMDVLEATHQTEIKEYSGLGKMVLAIDGNKPDARHFWEFFVNGKSSNVGASSYILKAGDKIEWKLSAIK